MPARGWRALGEPGDLATATPLVAAEAVRGVAAEAERSAEHGPDCESMPGMDASAPNLCQAHCQQDSQSEAGPLPMLVPAAAGRFYGVEGGARAGLRPLAGPAESRPLAATFPPHATLHCCLRV
jgi:hypothetical protein